MTTFMRYYALNVNVPPREYILDTWSPSDDSIWGPGRNIRGWVFASGGGH